MHIYLDRVDLLLYSLFLFVDNSRASITPEKHMLVFLWFAGHQTSSFRDVADRFDISLSSLHAIITRVSGFLSYMAGNVIKWPTPEERQMTMAKGFPNIIGRYVHVHIPSFVWLVGPVGYPYFQCKTSRVQFQPVRNGFFQLLAQCINMIIEIYNHVNGDFRATLVIIGKHIINYIEISPRKISFTT
jgi:hypothetical protein